MLQQHKEENKNKRGKSETQEVAKSRREAKEGDEMMGEEDPKVTADHRPEERDQTRANRFFYHQCEKKPWYVTSCIDRIQGIL